MRIATWNVNGLRARIDFVRLWLESRRPDVVGFQELKLEDDQFPHELFRELGYHALTHGQRSWNGVAILTREPAELLDRGLLGQEELGARVIAARVADLRFTTVYVPNGKSVEHADYPRKLAWLDALREALAAGCHAAGPAILCGDFNIAPTPIDTWNEAQLKGHIFHTDAERAATKRCSTAAGPTCSGCSIPTSGSIRGGTIGAARSTARWVCASTCCWGRRACWSASGRCRSIANSASRSRTADAVGSRPVWADLD